MVDTNRDSSASTWKMRALEPLMSNISSMLKWDALGKEIANIAIPAAMALAADPIASLIDTAFIGHIGPVQLAAVGVAVAIFNQVSKITIFPLVSITTSFVAEEDACINDGSTTASLELSSDELEVDEKTVKQEKVKEDTNEKEAVDVEKGLDSQIINREEVIKGENRGADSNNVTTNLVHQQETPTQKKETNPAPAAPAQHDEHLEKRTVIAALDGGKETKKNEKIYKESKKKRQRRGYMASVSSALVIGTALGLVQTLFLVFTAKPLISVMGIKSGSPMLNPALEYLTLRSLGAPAVLLSLAMQGIFRGFNDTKTPLYAILAGDVMNVILDPIFIFTLRMKVGGAAIAHVISQYLILIILLLKLTTRVDILPPSLSHLRLGRFLKSGGLLLGRVVAVTFCVTLAASLAARQGTTPMAAFQICLQVWMTISLLADGLAVAAQAILASAFATKDHDKATRTATRAIQLSLALGAALALVVGVGLRLGSQIFTKDERVIHLIHFAIPFVAATQPINSMAFVLDGVNFGASDFAYTAYSMIAVAAVSIGGLLFLSKSFGFLGIWVGLIIYMGLRTLAGYWRVGTASGPWRFRRN